jgi:hypothetical protein
MVPKKIAEAVDNQHGGPEWKLGAEKGYRLNAKGYISMPHTIVKPLILTIPIPWDDIGTLTHVL